jgi:hypothetical protein
MNNGKQTEKLAKEKLRLYLLINKKKVCLKSKLMNMNHKNKKVLKILNQKWTPKSKKT